MDWFCVELYSINDMRSRIKDILAFVNDMLDICPEKQYDVRLVLNELLANCFLHGNCEELLPVKVKVSIEDCNIDIYVSHLCKDFEAKIASLHDAIDLYDFLALQESGRGLKIVSTLCETIEIQQKGIHVSILNR